MATRLTYVMKFVADMEAAVAFHRDVLGLRLRFQSAEWSEFDTGETTLALHGASDQEPAGGAEMSPTKSGAPGRCEATEPAARSIACTKRGSPKCRSSPRSQRTAPPSAMARPSTSMPLLAVPMDVAPAYAGVASGFPFSTM